MPRFPPQHGRSSIYLVIRCRNHASRAKPKIRRSNVGQASRVVQKGGVWSDVANVGSEGAKVAVTLQRAEAVQVACALVEELLRGGEVLVGIGVFSHPDFLAGESASGKIQVFHKYRRGSDTKKAEIKLTQWHIG